ncbi:MAG TPA: nitroreductase family protein [Casimicrobiaceae bacterium]|nr:nitroreductase family protein [Casimicrobiaceae bacterium]
MTKRVVERILDLARWAPSGDNTQPWRFEILADDHVVIHGFDTRERCLYDFDGHPSQIALGALIENIAIAARSLGREATTTRRGDAPETQPRFDVRLRDAPGSGNAPLAGFIEARSVQRRPLRTRPLTPAEKSAIETAAGPDHRLRWFEGFPARRSIAWLLFHNAKLRLTAPEAYAVHRDVIAWHSAFSDDRVPDGAIGLDPMTTRLMAWVMRSWRRVAFFNRYLAGTLVPRIELDLVPGLACAAHFLIVARTPPANIDDFVAAGRAMQRAWLTATSLGLQLQPEMTPLIFAMYVRAGRHFSSEIALWQRACELALRFERLAGPDAAAAVFMGRLGEGPAPRARSLRLPLADLMVR